MKNDGLMKEDLNQGFCRIDKVLKEYVVEERLEIFIYGEIPHIDDPDVIDLIQNIENTKADQIIITIMSSGGSLYSALAIYNALTARKNDCSIVTIANAFVASGAAIIFMAGELRYCYKYTTFMIHAPIIEGYVSGKMSNYSDEYKSLNALYRQLVEDNFKDILTDGEIENMMKGPDVYMTTEEALERKLVHMVLENFDNINEEEESEAENG